MLTGIFGWDFGYNMGNLKTAFLTWNLYLDYKAGMKIYANYPLKFPYTQLKGFGSILEILKNENNIAIGIDELHTYMDCYSPPSKKSGGWQFKELARQTRKNTVKLYVDAQSYADVHKSIRRVLFKVWLTRKLDMHYQPCYDDYCHQPHIIEVFDVKTNKTVYYPMPLEIFDLYDTSAVVEWEENIDLRQTAYDKKHNCKPKREKYIT